MLLVLTGGVGGAKLALGLARTTDPADVAFLVNTGDDFEHLGLTICPDLDTLTYTLAGEAHPEQGWGLADESFRTLERVARLGGPDWFRLGDRDLALHLVRSERLRGGSPLSEVTRDVTRRLGIAHTVLPMSDDPVRTVVHTLEGDLPFQTYFVGRRCEPAVTGFSFRGAERARLNGEAAGLLGGGRVRGVVIAPSNPFVSIEPLLAVPGLRERLRNPALPVLAVSPIVAGAALKGPTAKMMGELGLDPGAVAVARRYADFLTHFVLDESDAALAEPVRAEGPEPLVTGTVMRSLEDREALARFCLNALRS